MGALGINPLSELGHIFILILFILNFGLTLAGRSPICFFQVVPLPCVIIESIPNLNLSPADKLLQLIVVVILPLATTVSPGAK